MKNKLYTYGILISMLSALSACHNNASFTVSGDVDNLKPNDKVYLLEVDSTETKKIDSSSINGQHTFQLKATSPFDKLFLLQIGNAQYNIIAKNGDALNFKSDLSDSSHAYELSGSDESQKIQEFTKINNTYSAKLAVMANEFESKGAAQPTKKDSLLAVYRPVFMKTLKEQNQAVVDFVNENKSSLAAFYAAQQLDRYNYEQQLVAYADAIKGKFINNPDVQKFIKQMEVAKPLSIGHQAPNFTAASIDGKQVSLSDYKGKYVMLDFWASWCVPCRQENPNVVKQYAAYKDKGLNILGISLDVDKKPWQKAVSDDHITWQQVSDLKRFDGPIEQSYHIEAIPSNFIIDPSGNIVAKNVTGEDLQDFLKKTFTQTH